LRATFIQFLTPNILISWTTPSSHRNFGLPTLLAPSGWGSYYRSYAPSALPMLVF
jgi:hypothetical protein